MSVVQEPWRILIVDDNEELAKDLQSLLSASPVSDADAIPEVAISTKFDDALALLERENFDLLILDVRDESRTAMGFDDGDDNTATTPADAGLTVFQRVREKRFVPVIFYTALPDLVEEDARPGPPFVAVVSKLADDPNGELQSYIGTVFKSTLPAIHRALLTHVEQVVRDFMGGFVQEHWPELGTPPRKGDVAHLLLRRLSLTLGQGAPLLEGELAEEPIALDEDKVHPMRYYVIPPLDGRQTGDILRHQTAGTDAETTWEWFVVLTPACDLVSSRVKSDFVTLARCVPLQGFEEYTKFAEANPDPGAEPTAKTRDPLLKLMHNNRGQGQADRWAYLPSAWEVPDLLVDFQQISCIPYADLEGYECVAALDSPYAEWLVQRFVRFVGRIGTPDLDVNAALQRLRSSDDQTQSSS